MEGATLTVDNLACRRGERVLFRGLSFDLGPGEALQVRGANGTGKSSLLRIVAGLLRPLAGTVEHRGGISLLDSNLALDEHLPLGKAFDFWRRMDGGGYGPTRYADWGLAGLEDVPVRFLSTGQRKRAALMQSSARLAALWLLDEPLNGLDAEGVASLQDEIRVLREHGFSVLLASHQPLEVPDLRTLDLADYIPPLPGGEGIEGWGLPTPASETPTQPPPNGGGA
jgi:heme exporter protein A